MGLGEGEGLLAKLKAGTLGVLIVDCTEPVTVDCT